VVRRILASHRHLPELPLPTMSATTLPAAAIPERAHRDEGPPSASLAIALQATLLSHPQLNAAAAAWVRDLALRLHVDRASVGLKLNGELRAVAHSNGLPVAHATPEIERLRRAWAEALDQSASIVFPEPRPQAHPRITLAHSRLRATPAGAAASVPLVAAGVAIGALCVERDAGLISAAELDTLEHLACLAAPVLDLMRLNQRPLAERLHDRGRDLWARQGRRGSRWIAVAAGTALAALVLWPIDAQVGGHARLEGAVQRALVAPADGFVSHVHARPGDLVQAGQVLVELADQDLQLELQRWQSALAQHENAYANANAHADRAQQVIHQSRAAEAEAQLALVQMKLERGRITAPFDAIVVQGDLSQTLGAPVTQGAELLTLAPQGRFRVIVEVDERDIARIAIGQTGTLALTALPWDTLPLRVARITPMASALEGRNVFEVEAELASPGASLRPGLQGSAHIVVGRSSWLVSASRRVLDGLRLVVWAWWG
jgi:Barrel-sandwich domain of CusB or HlyD membrane-fusion